ncbi:MAG: hypothetical protein WKG00_05170 [Polyangiaceae bacterium]
MPTSRVRVASAPAFSPPPSCATASFLGRGQATADRVVSGLVLADPPLIDRDENPPARTAALCAAASPALARKCVERLRELQHTSYLRSPTSNPGPILEAADRLARGDCKGAAASLRPLLAIGTAPDAHLA